MSDDNHRYVRVKPYDSRNGYKVQSYTLCGVGKFEAAGGWYRVSVSAARQLNQCVQDEADPRSPKVFDICSKDEMVEISQREAGFFMPGRVTAPADPERTASQRIRVRDRVPQGAKPVSKRTPKVEPLGNPVLDDSTIATTLETEPEAEPEAVDAEHDEENLDEVDSAAIDAEFDVEADDEDTDGVEVEGTDDDADEASEDDDFESRLRKQEIKVGPPPVRASRRGKTK